MPERRKSRTGITDAVRGAIEDYDRPVNSGSVWHAVQVKIPRVDPKAVDNAIRRLVEQGEVDRFGQRPYMTYQMKAKPAMSATTNGTHPPPVFSAPIAPVDVADTIPNTPQIPNPVELDSALWKWESKPRSFVVPAPLPVARRIGGYSIRTEAFLMADLSTPEQVTIYTCVLEIDKDTRLNKNKRLLFRRSEVEYADTLRWIADMERGALDPAAADQLAQAKANEDAALEMAEKAQTELDAARAKIVEYEEMFAPFLAKLQKSM